MDAHARRMPTPWLLLIAAFIYLGGRGEELATLSPDPPGEAPHPGRPTLPSER